MIVGLLLLNGAVTRVPLIIDTDIGCGGCRDVDDVAAICLANALVDRKEVDLLAVVQNTAPPPGAGVISVLNHFYGHDRIAIGAYRGKDVRDETALPYTYDLVRHWPSPIKNTSQVPSGVGLYRKVLAAQADGSVVISSIGLLTNLASLLKSSPDAHSSLPGSALVASKVRALWVMGGRYPTSTVGPFGCECNFCGAFHGGLDHAAAAAASQYVVSHLPSEVKVVYSGFEVGYNVQAGSPLAKCASLANPCRQAFIDYLGPGRDHMSWDPLTTLAAVRGPAAVGCSECDAAADCNGVNSVDGGGNNTWHRSATSASAPRTNQTYLLLHNASKAASAINELLCQPPSS